MFSDAGVAYGRVNQRWGTDPGTPFSDDVIAFNVRAGLLVAMANAEPEPDEPDTIQPRTQGKIVTDLEEQMKAYVDR